MINNGNKTANAPTTSSLIPEECRDSELFRMYTLILNGITDHMPLPDKKLTESKPCRQVTCLHNTVRSTFLLLAHDKIVDLQPNRDAPVHVSDLKEMQDVFSIRIEMEGMILGTLVNLLNLEARSQPLYAMIEHEEVASDGGDRAGWNCLSSAFHIEPVRLLGSDVLSDTINMLCARSPLIVAVFDAKRREKRPTNTHTHAEHREILDLLISDKRSRVVKITRRHPGACIECLE